MEWISVKEKLPDLPCVCLIYIPEHYEYEINLNGYGYVDFTNEMKFGHDCMFEDKVTHWMPLPEPPKSD